MTTKAVIYARYSSHNQREESIEGQLRECHEFADKNDLTVIAEYCDRAISGKTDHRPEFQRMIRDSERGHFDAVIMYTLDRFARNRYDSAIYKARLKRNGVKIYYAKQPMPDSPEGIILESVLEGYAEYYSENLARGIKRGLKENALQGIAMGTPTLGYRIGPDRHYEIDPIGAKAVREIFTRYVDGETSTEIVNYLNEAGFKTSRGNAFNKNSINRILHNDKYIGVYRFSDVVLENAVPAIIDKELFYQAQRKLSSTMKARARHKAKEEYLLSTKVFCGHCGEPLIGESGNSKNGTTHRYYKCAGRKRKHNCTKAVEKKDSLEAAVIRYTIEKVLTDENIDRIASRVIQLAEKDFNDKTLLHNLRQQQKDIDKRIANLLSAIEQGIVTDSTKSRLLALESDRKDLEKQIACEDSKKPFLTKDHIVYWLNLCKKGSINDTSYCRQMIDALVNAIYVYDTDDPLKRKIVITYNVSGNNTYTFTRSDIDSSSPLYDVNPNTFVIVKGSLFGFGTMFFLEV